MDMENPVRMVTWSVEEVMKDEWEQMRAEDSRLPHLTRYRNRRVPLAGATGFGKSKRKSPYASSLCAEDEFEVNDGDLSMPDFISWDLSDFNVCVVGRCQFCADHHRRTNPGANS